MPQYPFLCDPNEGGCGNTLTLECSISEYPTKQRKSCPKCKKRKPWIRDFSHNDNPVFMPKSLGHHIDRQSDRMSADEKHHLTTKHNEYKDQRPPSSWTPTPDGMIHNG